MSSTLIFHQQLLSSSTNDCQRCSHPATTLQTTGTDGGGLALHHLDVQPKVSDCRRLCEQDQEADNTDLMTRISPRRPGSYRAPDLSQRVANASPSNDRARPGDLFARLRYHCFDISRDSKQARILSSKLNVSTVILGCSDVC